MSACRTTVAPIAARPLGPATDAGHLDLEPVLLAPGLRCVIGSAESCAVRLANSALVQPKHCTVEIVGTVGPAKHTHLTSLILRLIPADPNAADAADAGRVRVGPPIFCPEVLEITRSTRPLAGPRRSLERFRPWICRSASVFRPTAKSFGPIRRCRRDA